MTATTSEQASATGAAPPPLNTRKPLTFGRIVLNVFLSITAFVWASDDPRSR